MNKRLEHIREVIKKGLDPLSKNLIHPLSYVDQCVSYGKNLIVGPNSTIGWHSAGCEWDENGHLVRFPQYGKVEIGDDVFICANVHIGRATNNENITKIGDRCIIGPGVNIGHNAIIGDDTAILGNTTIEGGAVVGKGCCIGPKALIRTYTSIGDGSTVGSASNTLKDIPPGEIWFGNPAKFYKRIDLPEDDGYDYYYKVITGHIDISGIRHYRDSIIKISKQSLKNCKGFVEFEYRVEKRRRPL